jgi:hypothetical protein
MNTGPRVPATLGFRTVKFFGGITTTSQPTFRNIVFCEAKAAKGKKNNILEN